MRPSTLLSSLLCSPILSYCFKLEHFFDPPPEYRPKFRYLLPDASIPPAELERDVRDLARVGAGGLELVPFYFYGNPTDGPTPTDWSVYGFGTPAFVHLFETALQTAFEEGILLDFSLGASQGQGTPAQQGTPGLAKHLQLGWASLEPGATYNGSLPAPAELAEPIRSGGGFMHGLDNTEAGDLIAVVAAQVLTDESIVSGDVSAIMLNESSLVDLTAQTSNLSLHWKAPSHGKAWRVFALWESFTNQKSCSGAPNATSIIANGSWVVDHFSEAGAKLHTSFFEDNILSGEETKARLRDVRALAWEDSIEMQFALPWTHGFLERFEKDHNYSLVNYLPLLFTKSNSWSAAVAPYLEEFSYDAFSRDGESIHSRNFRTTLGYCYQDYLAHHGSWAKGLGLRFSTQPSYNLPLSFNNEIPFVDAPEGESLGFADLIDAYRSLAGSAHLSGKQIISTEVGAVFEPAFSQSVTDLLTSIKKSFAGGLTMMVIHAFGYGGRYPGNTWPGFQAFGYFTTEMWGRVQPAWEHMPDTMSYIARNQYILQSGRPSVDLLFCEDESVWKPRELYKDTNLRGRGFTYDFVSPQNLDLPLAIVKDRVLAPEGPAYKALIFNNQSMISPDTFEKIKEFSVAGLPIFFIAQIPWINFDDDTGYPGNLSQSLESFVNATDGVNFVRSEERLLDALHDQGVAPRTSLSSDSRNVHNVRRNVSEEGLAYIWFYNDDNRTASFQTRVESLPSSKPYFLDSWTGLRTKVSSYEIRDESMVVDISLAPQDTVILAFEYSNHTVTSLSDDASPLSRIPSQHRGSPACGEKSTTASLKLWNITISDWYGDYNSDNVEPLKKQHVLLNQELLPWKDLRQDLANVSGVGTYTTMLTMPSLTPDLENAHLSAVWLSLPPFSNTARAWINGKQLNPLNPSGGRVEISDHVKGHAESNLTIEVTTTLFNRVKADADKILQISSPVSLLNPAYSTMEPKGYGLLGKVTAEWIF